MTTCSPAEAIGKMAGYKDKTGTAAAVVATVAGAGAAAAAATRAATRLCFRVDAGVFAVVAAGQVLCSHHRMRT